MAQSYPYRGEDCCLIHGAEHMRSTMGNPIPWCEACEEARKQPDLHAPGWPEMRFHGHAETDGIIWWWEDRQPDGSIKRQPLVPYAMEAK